MFDRVSFAIHLVEITRARKPFYLYALARARVTLTHSSLINFAHFLSHLFLIIMTLQLHCYHNCKMKEKMEKEKRECILFSHGNQCASALTHTYHTCNRDALELDVIEFMKKKEEISVAFSAKGTAKSNQTPARERTHMQRTEPNRSKTWIMGFDFATIKANKMLVFGFVLSNSISMVSSVVGQS